jgi:hypothetical protein
LLSVDQFKRRAKPFRKTIGLFTQKGSNTQRLAGAAILAMQCQCSFPVILHSLLLKRPLGGDLSPAAAGPAGPMLWQWIVLISSLTCLLVMLGFSVTGTVSGLVMLTVELVWLRTGHSMLRRPIGAGAVLDSFTSKNVYSPLDSFLNVMRACTKPCGTDNM